MREHITGNSVNKLTIKYVVELQFYSEAKTSFQVKLSKNLKTTLQTRNKT